MKGRMGVGERRKGREGTEFAGVGNRNREVRQGCCLGMDIQGTGRGLSQAHSSLESGADPQRHLF